MSCSRSIPGYTSMSLSPFSVSSNTHRSVTYITLCLFASARFPEKLMLLTSFTNLGMLPSFLMVTMPSLSSTASPFVSNVRQNTTVAVLAVIFANPPTPANAPGPLWAFTFPNLSTSIPPMKQISRPPLL